METKERKIVICLIVLSGLLILPLVVHSGNLEPSAAPWPTMKTLDEVEPRKALEPEVIPIGANYQILIDEPGSYYLTQNVAINFRHAIKITASSVTLDLMGFRLYSSWAPPTMENQAFDGIYIGQDCKDVEIRNGTIVSDQEGGNKGFRYGVYAPGSPDVSRTIRVLDLRVSGCRYGGIYLNCGNVMVKSCVVIDNGTSYTDSVYGICAGSGSTVTGNTAYKNGYSATGDVYGIRAGYGSTVARNTAYKNGYSATGNVVNGIDAGYGSTVTGNTAYQNGYSADGDAVYGICAWYGCVVTGNTAYLNGHSADGMVQGIYADRGCTVTGNTAYHNGTYAGGTAYGIHLVGNNLVDQNTAYGNGDTNMNDPGTCTFGTNHAP